MSALRILLAVSKSIYSCSSGFKYNPFPFIYAFLSLNVNKIQVIIIFVYCDDIDNKIIGPNCHELNHDTKF